MCSLSETNGEKTGPTQEIPTANSTLSDQARLCANDKLSTCANSNVERKRSRRARLLTDMLGPMRLWSSKKSKSPGLEFASSDNVKSNQASDCAGTVKPNFTKSNISVTDPKRPRCCGNMEGSKVAASTKSSKKTKPIRERPTRSKSSPGHTSDCIDTNKPVAM